MSANELNKPSDKILSKQQSQSLQQQEKIQAIVLLDSYSNKFEPFSSSFAECLLPFGGSKTMLDNNIEFLIENDVEEIYLFCTRHHKQIKQYIDEKKWHHRVEIHFLYNFKCQSLGDAIREIDAKGLVRSNFILITATSIVSNIKIKDHLETHKQTSKIDKNAIMTIMCYNKTNEISLSESISIENKTSIILSRNNRILNYEQLKADSFNPKSKYIKMPIDKIRNTYSSSNQTSKQQAIDNANAKLKFKQISNEIGCLNAENGLQGDSIESISHLKTVQQRTDLLESQIYFCSPYVLHIFTDNFDFDTMDDFIRGVLVDEEVAGYTIYVDCFKKKFGSHYTLINNLNSYYYETMRLLQRPDLLFDLNQSSNFNRMLDRLNVFVNKQSYKFTDSLKLERNVLIGSNCKIGDNCELVNSLVSDNCIIGNNVKISNSIIWSNTVIGNYCSINATLIGKNVRIGNNCTIIENSVFSNDCVVKDGTYMKVRGVFYKKDNPVSALTKISQNFSVQEDNYVKYISTTRFTTQNESEDEKIDDDDEFDSMDHSHEYDEDEDEDDQSITLEAKNDAGDTSKNSHFFIWKLRSEISNLQGSNSLNENDSSISNKLLRQTENNFGSDINLNVDSSDYSTDSSDEDMNNQDYGSNLDYDDCYDNEEARQKQSKLYSNLNQHEDTDIFLNEVIDSLQRGLKQNLDSENIILEINSSKHANNIQIDDLCYYLARAFFYLPIMSYTNANNLPSNEITIEFDYFKLIKVHLKKYNSILHNYYTRSRFSQKQFLTSYQDFFVETKFSVQINNNKISFIDAYYVKLLHHMYNECDFLNEEEILEWFNRQKKANLENKGPSEFLELRKYANQKLEPFIKWLKEAEEENDDDDDDK